MTTPNTDPAVLETLRRGVVIPAHPLALTSARKLDERRQRALSRYYLDAGSGGLAVGVHTTQFAIRDPAVGLLEPVLTLASEEMDRADASRKERVIRVAGLVGETGQAVREAELACGLGYHAGLLSLAAWQHAGDEEILAHCMTVSNVIPIFGFYLQPAVGGRVLDYAFWREFAEIERLVAIKIAPFNRYQTLDVVRAVAEAGRGDIALYTGNDDNIVLDLLSGYRISVRDRPVCRQIVGGLLGHWAVWTRKAVDLLEQCHALVRTESAVPPELLELGNEVTDCNAALFDVANAFKGCVAGIHEVLRRQGLLENIHCLDPVEGLSGGQKEEIDRVYKAYPHLNDDEFVASRRDQWLA